ncbi:hypothetical protein FXO37_21532 [Capsicum annuum]|nr:hypothetical protein FXO37_21532 [Capsicum annuum]
MCFGVPVFYINPESVKKLVISGYWQQRHEDSDEDNNDDKKLTIWARSVTSLEISGCFHKKIPVLHNVQALVDAKINFFRIRNDNENRESDFRTDQKMLKDLYHSSMLRNSPLGHGACRCNRISNEVAPDKVGTTCVVEKMREERLKWFVHFMRRISDDPVINKMRET